MSATVHNLADRRRRPEPDFSEPLVTKAQLADHLGFSTRWVELRVAEGLPHYKVGGRLRFHKSQATRWLVEQGERDGSS